MILTLLLLYDATTIPVVKPFTRLSGKSPPIYRNSLLVLGASFVLARFACTRTQVNAVLGPSAAHPTELQFKDGLRSTACKNSSSHMHNSKVAARSRNPLPQIWAKLEATRKAILLQAYGCTTQKARTLER